MSPHARRKLGNEGERLAETFLTGLGMRVLARQYKTQTGEIDLVCQHGSEIIFVEVKARRSRAFGYPEESVTQEKIKKILSVGEQFLTEKKLEDMPHRIDVIAIEWVSSNAPEIKHFTHIGLS